MPRPGKLADDCVPPQIMDVAPNSDDDDSDDEDFIEMDITEESDREIKAEEQIDDDDIFSSSGDERIDSD